MFLGAGARRRNPLVRNVHRGAKEGLQVAIGIVPYLVCDPGRVGALRASGALDAALGAIRAAVNGIGLDSRWVDAMPTALIKPLSGGGRAPG